MKLLTVDWDYFFPMPNPDSDESFMLYDWAQSESEFLIRHIWESRAQGFVMNGLPLPRVEGWSGFWNQFKIADDATLYMGESHLFAIDPEVREDIDEVWLFDAHHDAGYRGDESILRDGEERWECENWMVWYDLIGADLHVRYPEWRAWALDREPEPMATLDRQVVSETNMPDDVVFDRIYVCRSGAWVPPWCDAEFNAWAEETPVSWVENVGPVEWQPDVERDFDLDRVKAQAEFFRTMIDAKSST